MSLLLRIRDAFIAPKRLWVFIENSHSFAGMLAAAFVLCTAGFGLSSFIFISAPELSQSLLRLQAKLDVSAHIVTIVVIGFLYTMYFVALILNGFSLWLATKLLRVPMTFTQAYGLVTYSAAPALLIGSIPVVGQFTSIWMELLKFFGLRGLKQTSTGKTFGIVLLADLLLFVLILCGSIVGVLAYSSFPTSRSQTVPSTIQSQQQELFSATQGSSTEPRYAPQLPPPDWRLMIPAGDKQNLVPCDFLLRADAVVLLGTDDFEAETKGQGTYGKTCEFGVRVPLTKIETSEGQTQYVITAHPAVALQFTWFKNADDAYALFSQWKSTYDDAGLPTRVLRIADAPFIVEEPDIFDIPGDVHLFFYRELRPSAFLVGKLTVKDSAKNHADDMEDLILKIFSRLNEATGTVGPL